MGQCIRDQEIPVLDVLTHLVSRRSAILQDIALNRTPLRLHGVVVPQSYTYPISSTFQL